MAAEKPTTNDQPSGQGELAVPLHFVNAESTPVQFANHFIVQNLPGAFVLSISQFTPPVLVGTPEERRELAKQIEQVPVHTLGRFAFTRSSMVRLISFLGEQLERYDAASGNEADDGLA